MPKAAEPPVWVEVDERLDLCGFAYFKEGGSKGRVFWACEPAEGHPGKHSLSVTPSWGFPSDRAMVEIKRALIKYVTSPRKGPEIPRGASNGQEDEAQG